MTVGPFRAGSPYQANDLAALRWIYATLVETALMTHDFVLPPLTGEERARYYTESHRFAALFGIPRATLPADWRSSPHECGDDAGVRSPDGQSRGPRDCGANLLRSRNLVAPAAMVSCRHGVDAGRRGCGRHLA